MKTLLAGLLTLAAPAALAQAPPTPAGTPVRTITVAGAAIVSAAPDQARVRFGVVTEGETAEATLSAHERDVQRVLTAVRGLGIADRQIQLEWVGLNERYGEQGPEGYSAHRVVTVTVDDLRQVPELVALVVGEGANRLQGVEYTLRDDDAFEDEALAAAFARAREKAERLAQAGGATLGGVVAVVEQGVHPPPPVPLYRAESVAMDATPGAYSAGSSEVRAAVVVTFELQD